MNYTYDAASKSYMLSVKWTPRIDVDGAYVAEQIGDGFVTEFGPMPLYLVHALIEERREWVKREIERQRKRMIAELAIRRRREEAAP